MQGQWIVSKSITSIAEDLAEAAAVIGVCVLIPRRSKNSD